MDTQVFRQWAKEEGFADVGFCSMKDFAEEEQLVALQAELAERKQLRFAPQKDHPEAQSLAVLLWAYRPAPLPKGDKLFIDSYYQASNAAYHAARVLELRLVQNGIYAKANVAYPAKKAAVRAGMGRIGKNSLLITPEYGTRVVIILMATDIPYQKDDEERKNTGCLNCGRCILACPVHALDDQGMSRPERCLRNYMMEGNVAPQEYRKKIGMRLLGCDVCQRVCPMQPQLPEAEEETLFCADDFITDDGALFSQNTAKLAKKIGKNAARPQRIRAQAALIAGNAGNPAYIPVLRHWAESEFEAVRVHAGWALHQIEQRCADRDRT